MRSAERLRYSILVPFHNEEGNVFPLYRRIVAVMEGLGRPFEMVFVDDGSSDRTFERLSELFEADHRVHVLRLSRNFGQTPALKAAIDFARGEVVVPMDGDQQDDPADIPALVARLEEGYDIVSGWRRDRKEPWLTRRLPSQVANRIIARISGVELHDFGATFKAYRAEVIKEIDLYGQYHRFIPALVGRAGVAISEVPIRNSARGAGTSHYGLARIPRVALDMVRLKFLLDYSKDPLASFGAWGLLLMALALALLAYAGWRVLALGESLLLDNGGVALAAALLAPSGLQLLGIGLLGELVKAGGGAGRRRIYTIRETLSRQSSGSLVPLAHSRRQASGGNGGGSAHDESEYVLTSPARKERGL